MSIPGAASPLFLAATAAGPAAGFEISRSLRFNKADSAYLNRTPSSAGNRRTFTHSFWLKRSSAGSQRTIFSANTSSNFNNGWQITINNDDTLSVNGTSPAFNLTTSQVLRDQSAWYHIVIATDTTQSTSSNRQKIYINGEPVTTFGTSNYPSQNAELNCNGAFFHQIGGLGYTSSVDLDGYLAEINFVDGSALDPTSFGAFDTNGVWQAIDTAGLTFGTNGFRLKFANSADLGEDNSGNGNDWTPNNLVGSVTEWSSYGDGNSYWAATVFDSTTTQTTFPGNTTMTWNANAHATGIAWSTSLKIRYLKNTNGGPFVFNGTTLSLSNTGHLNWTTVDISSQVTSPLRTISLSRPSSGSSESALVAIYVDDVLVTDELASGIDSLVDTPSNAATPSDTGAGGEVVGNYATLNPLDVGANISNAQGNLYALKSTTGWTSQRSTIGASTGKYYFEGLVTGNIVSSGTQQQAMIGVSTSLAPLSSYVGSDANGWAYNFDGLKVNNGTSSYGTAFTGGDIISVAIDLDNNKIWFAKNGTWQASGDPAAGTNAAFTNLTGTVIPTISLGGFTAGNVSWDMNFGQRSFAYSAPTNFKALNTASLPTPTIADGSQYFDVDTYTGTGNTHERSEFSFAPDFVWFKERGGTKDHNVYDIIRGATKELFPNGTGTENTLTNGLTSFDSDGFTLGAGTRANGSGQTYVAWAWDGGTSTVTNNDGSISSSVRANPSAGFSIVKYTSGTGTQNDTVGHSLNDVPQLILLKRLDGADPFVVSHKTLSTGEYLELNSTSGIQTSASCFPTAHTSSVFGIGTDGRVNAGGNSYIAYCFAPVAGYSFFTKYVSNGSTDGPFVHLGFRPSFLMIKGTGTNSAFSWVILDSTRSEINPTDHALFPNSGENENDLPGFGARTFPVDFLSNGFKIRVDSSSLNHGSSEEYIVAAFAEHPFASNGGLAR